MLNDRLDSDVLRHQVRTDARAHELMRKRTESLQRFRKQYEAGGERFVVAGKPRGTLWYVFDVDVFKGPPGRMRSRCTTSSTCRISSSRGGIRSTSPAIAPKACCSTLGARSRSRRLSRDVKSDDFSSTMAAKLIPGS
jgi:hypothetical protein